MNVTLEGRWLDEYAQPVTEEPREGVDEMVRALIAVMDKRILALDDFHVGRLLIQRRDVWIVLPQAGTGRTHVCQKLAGAALVQIPHRSREHHNVPGGLEIAEDELAHGAGCLVSTGKT